MSGCGTSDFALGATIVSGLVLLVLVVGLLDLRRRGRSNQVSGHAVRRGLARQEARYGKETPQGTGGLGPYS